jgi:hypothetical protein
VSLGLYALNGGHLDIVPTCLSVIWAGVVGIYIRTYNNWLIHSSTERAKYFKGLLLSLSFNYTFLFIANGLKTMSESGYTPTSYVDTLGVFLAGGLASLSFFSWEGIKTHFHSLTNTIINAWVKNHLGETPRMRTRANMNRRIISLFGRKVEQSYLEGQVTSGTGSVLKFLDLVNLGKIETPVGVDFSWGRIIFIATGLISIWFNKIYSDKHDLKEKEVHRARWERMKLTLSIGNGEKAYSVSIPYLGIITTPIFKLTEKSLGFIRSFFYGVGTELGSMTQEVFKRQSYTEYDRLLDAYEAYYPTCSGLFSSN